MTDTTPEPAAVDLTAHNAAISSDPSIEQTPVEAFTQTFVEEGNASLKRIAVIAILLVVLAGLFSLLSPSTHVARREAILSSTEDNQATRLGATQFPQVQLQAKAAYVYDITSQKALYAKNADAQLPLASITKLMTVLVAAELFHNEGLLTFGNEDLSGMDNASPFPSTRWVPNDVFTYTLIQSSNLGASTIANAVGALAPESTEHDQARDIFIEHMNQKARDIGLKQTYFINETGLDASQTVGGGYGSARDAALLLATLAESHIEILEQTRLPAVEFEASDQSKMVAINTNTEIRSIPGLLGSKTGYTRLAGGNLVILFDAGLGHPIVIAVLGSTEEGRFHDVKLLTDASLQYLSDSNSTTP